MNSFDNELHKIVESADGSYTAYSKEYDEHYHSTKDGALSESLFKHVHPAFLLKESQDDINILDICFGLGFNTLATICHHKKKLLSSKLSIFSPELDTSLVKSLKSFIYPKEFDEFKSIICELSESGVYIDENLHIEIFLGDAREYVRALAPEKFDIIYQDAFSPSSNPLLWTKEYFGDIKKVIKEDGVLTTYSTALATRLALYENGFNIYINSGYGYRNATVASLRKLEEFKDVDMEHKIRCNPNTKSLRD